MVTEGVEPSTVALLAQRSNQLSYATSPIHIETNQFISFLFLPLIYVILNSYMSRLNKCLYGK